MDRLMTLTRLSLSSPQMFAAAALLIASDAAACNSSVTTDATTVGRYHSTELTSSVHSADTLSFRWPVQGVVVFSCWQRTNSINIAVPEATPIQASESGVVAYAGNELGSFGNLVVLRHLGGYLTAYAHAREILVKRNDVVKRGDVIALSGQTGNVLSPQLRFEIQKGATSVDAMRYQNRNLD